MKQAGMGDITVAPADIEVKVKKPSKAELAEAEEYRDKLFSGLASNLNGELTKAVSDKAAIEHRMLNDEAQYWGSVYGGWDKEDMVANTGQSVRERRGAPSDNKTRSKTRIAAARIGDMLFPTNVANWALTPTPYPDIPIELVMEEYRKTVAATTPAQPTAPPLPAEGAMAAGGPPPTPSPEGGSQPMMEEAMDGMQPPMEGEAPPMEGELMPQEQQGPPLPEPDYDALAAKVASSRCRKMQQRIRDVLVENDYAKLGRQVIMDGCKLGTGIVKGPYVRYQMRHSYQSQKDGEGEIAVLKVERVKVPGVARVSPWMLFPQRARCIEESEACFELHLLNKTQLTQMIKTHGFYPRQVNKLLDTPPSLGVVESIIAKRAAITNYSMERYENAYSVWEYQGVIDADVLREVGFALEEDDNLTSYYGAVWLSGHCILRIDMSPLEAESRLPYQVWNYEEDETCIFGFGVPFVMRDDQYVIDMIWAAILHNVSVSAGPQLCIQQGVLIPADKSYLINGPKLWYKNDIDVPMAQAFEAFVIPSTLANTMPVYQQAIQNADTNTNLPLMLGDAMGTSQMQGASGFAQIAMMNQLNIVQRQAAHAWDDNVTDPLITRLYHWFMQGEDETIKGDFQVEVRGASHLLVKDTQAQHAQLLLQMASTDPTMAALLELDELYRIYLNFLDIPVDSVVKSPEKVAYEKANAQPDPMQDAELRKANAAAALDEAQAALKMAEAQAKGAGGQGPTQKEVMEMDIEYAKLQDKERDREHQMQVELLRRDTAMMKVASDEKISYQTVLADMEKSRQQLGLDQTMKQRKQESDDYFAAARLRLDKYREDLRTANSARGFDSF